MIGHFRYIPLWLLLLSGCAGHRVYQTDWRAAQESGKSVPLLATVPFYPQQKYQCGPAALATLLSGAGVETSPEALEPQLYIADRKGTLQVEMVAATRRQGLVPYVHSGGFNVLLEQLASGSAVLVLQNLGLRRWPRWHYAVVIGYSAEKETVYLRSGTTALLATPLRDFMRSWHDGNQWLMTVHQPDDIPAGADPVVYLEAANGLEQAGQPTAALQAYLAATQFWPKYWPAWVALGNRYYLRSEFGQAEQAFRQAARLAPEQPAPHHNLAWALIRQNRAQQALPFARAAADMSESPHYHSALNALNDAL